ncbi:MAG: hypothetical protein H6838_16325 [Planctomycetes bacterium]|nr:hypothetical protein [Planctomycetota bacterium]
MLPDYDGEIWAETGRYIGGQWPDALIDGVYGWSWGDDVQVVEDVPIWGRCETGQEPSCVEEQCPCAGKYEAYSACITDCSTANPDDADADARARCIKGCADKRTEYLLCLEEYPRSQTALCPQLSNVRWVHSDDPIICGVDVTNWLAQKVLGDWQDTQWGTSRGVLALKWTPRFWRDIKSDPQGNSDMQEEGSKLGCPRKCDFSFTLCGRCVKGDVPANIGSAVAITGREVKWIAGRLAVSGAGYGKDDKWDADSYRLGDSIRQKLNRKRRRRGGGVDQMSLADVKEAICEAVAESARSSKADAGTNRGYSMFRDCAPCTIEFEA